MAQPLDEQKSTAPLILAYATPMDNHRIPRQLLLSEATCRMENGCLTIAERTSNYHYTIQMLVFSGITLLVAIAIMLVKIEQMRVYPYRAAHENAVVMGNMIAIGLLLWGRVCVRASSRRTLRADSKALSIHGTLKWRCHHLWPASDVSALAVAYSGREDWPIAALRISSIAGERVNLFLDLPAKRLSTVAAQIQSILGHPKLDTAEPPTQLPAGLLVRPTSTVLIVWRILMAAFMVFLILTFGLCVLSVLNA